MYESPQIIAEVGVFLREPLPLAQEDLEMHIIGLEALRFGVAVATADQLQLLYEKRKQMLWPKDADKSKTELDRSTHLNADVAVIERDYRLLCCLEDLIGDRLNIGMRLLS